MRLTSLPDHLHLWLADFKSLRSLLLPSGEVLAEARVREALQRCPSLTSLEMYSWSDNRSYPLPISEMDESLAQSLASMAGKLERLAIHNARYCFGHSSLSALHKYHGPSLRILELYGFQPYYLPSLDLATRTPISILVVFTSPMTSALYLPKFDSLSQISFLEMSNCNLPSSTFRGRLSYYFHFFDRCG